MFITASLLLVIILELRMLIVAVEYLPIIGEYNTSAAQQSVVVAVWFFDSLFHCVFSVVNKLGL